MAVLVGLVQERGTCGLVRPVRTKAPVDADDALTTVLALPHFPPPSKRVSNMTLTAASQVLTG